MPTISTHDEAVKIQLASGLTSRCGSRIWTALWVRPCSNGSRLDGTGLAENPPDTPANAAAIPASGWRPAAWKITPPSGMTRT
jgi:hypothetical protein